MGRQTHRARARGRAQHRAAVSAAPDGRSGDPDPAAGQLDAPARAEALRLFDGPAEHNAVVVMQLLRERGVAATERVVQKVVAPRRRELRALQLATVRYETAPGHQMQVDFGQKRVRIGERTVVVHLLVAVLSYSRRIFVKAFLAERGDDWREGIAEAFR